MQTAELLPPASCKVYTPRQVADAMVTALRPARDATWLEPCVGQGVFLLALADAGVARSKIFAVDLDPVTCETDVLAATSRGLDFLTWSHSRGQRFDRIVGNPPYVPLSRLHQRLKEAALAVRVPGLDQTVPPTSNTWFAFLCGCVHILQKGGSLALVLPAAWDYAGYAAPLRERLPKLFREFFTFRSRRPLFDNVQDGCIIIVGRGYEEQYRRSRRIECSDKDDLVASMLSACIPEAPGTIGEQARILESGSGSMLRDILEIKLGGVTGHAEFFPLTEERRASLGLPRAAVIPVLSRSRHLTGAVIDRRSWDDLLRRGERVWLLRPTGEVLSLPSVAAYLARPLECDGCNRDGYKIKNRTPWYLTPLPERVDGFMSGMSRNGPWISLRHMQSLNATNTLYVVRFKEKLDICSKSAICLSMLTTRVREELRQRCRHYADGLMKHEPGDLGQIKLPLARETCKAPATYSTAVECLLAGKSGEASALADRFFDIPISKAT
jgi:adenine-specific DNA-methyltransferase